ncbi:hypothetical protein LO762_24550 [Actinocorallia sp. API 0066]|uniref:hypothetical protein n=1 Tax=Actinocorallia sp. API 0066 TaxID=2896846 RepID=UPI001E293656|nr:hypothetical protein [Actinocorallia sp. API 0066]MCD0452338.1 hypothetical protein [Actinocorallia sp. API 0066]
MLLRVCRSLAEAARTGDPQFRRLLEDVMRAASGEAPRDEMTAAANLLVDTAAEVMPQRGGWLAVMAGALAERGADADGIPIVERLSGVAAGALAFADAWGGTPPPAAAGPSREIWERTVQLMGDRAKVSMQCWYALPQFARGALALLRYSPATRAAVADFDEGVDRAVVHCEALQGVQELRRVLDGEPLLVLHRPTRQGWTVTMRGVTDNFQLHTLLAGLLVGGSVQGHAPHPGWVAAFADGEADPSLPPVEGWWDLTDAHGEEVWNEGVPADIPLLGETRVLVLDPPSYARSWTAARRHPEVPGLLTLDAAYHPDDLVAWWPVLKPPVGPG